MSILNPYPKRLPGPSLLHHLVQTNISDDTPALDYQDGQGARHTITYQRLHDDSNRLASRLHDLRVRSSQPRADRFIVPIFMGQCPELYIAQLAILKAGGAFCPMTLDVPEERLRFILGDTSATVLVTTSELSGRLPQLENFTIFLADGDPHDEHYNPVAVDIQPTMPAYVMYTSGSTGQPKGVVLSHSAATQALLAHDRHIPAFTRFLQFASPTFDVSVFEIFFPLFRGRTLVICERKRMLNDLPAAINALEIDAAELTPSVANSLLQGRKSVPKLKVLLTIGEMLKQSVIEEFGGSTNQPAVLHGMYGPTEATIHCTLQPNFAEDMPVNNIGFPLDTVSAFVIRPASAEHPSQSVEILPVGEEGELAVGGHQLADGYLNREKQTKAAFVSHPDYGQLYRTGDRAKLDSHQRLMCLGRISSGQVKLRGQRIELGEIEYAASRTPGCRDVVADVIADSLVVFCVSAATDLRERHIEETCRKWLPPYMVPTDILIMESMPYLASGKVDRRSLQSLHQSWGASQDSHSEPMMDEGVKHLAKLFKDVMGIEVSHNHSLSAVGIDSLSSIRVASALRKNGYPHVSATDLLEARTLSDLQDRLVASNSDVPSQLPNQSLLQRDDMQSTLESHQLLSSQMHKIHDIVACTPIQSAMLSETARAPQAYCNWIELHADLRRSMEDVKQAVHALISHHEMLRTGFAMLNDSQHPYVSVIWQDDHGSETLQVPELDYQYGIQNESQLIVPRPVQLKQTAAGTRVLFQLHHSLYDQWSVDLIKEDLDHLLHGKELLSRPSYTAVASFYSERHSQSTIDAGADYWQLHLEQAVTTPLPQLRGDVVASDLNRSEWLPLDIPIPSLKQTASETNSSAPAIFQAAYSYLLSLYTGTPDIMYGTAFSGRHIPVVGVERIVGPCLATLPSRTDVGSVRTCRDLIQMIYGQNRIMMKHSDVPLVKLKKIGGYSPNETMFDTLFVWQESTVAKPKFVTEVNSADQHELNLVLEVEPREDHVAVRVTYQRSRINRRQVDAFVEQLRCILLQLINEPQTLVSELVQSLPIHTMAIDNPNITPHSREAGLMVALEDVAKRVPNAPALVFAESFNEATACTQSLSYSEMHARANRLARHLISLNVQPDDLVCVCMDKSTELYVTILAVLKAGAGYLPLLPDTPKGRLESILEQTLPKVMLCDDTFPDDSRLIVETSLIDLSKVALDGYSSNSISLPYCGSHAAYSIFTSGSTGTPKGLIVTQDNLLGNLTALADIYPVTQDSRLLQACSQAFDVSVFEIFFALFTGMPLCFARKDELFQDIEHSIRLLEITHLSLTPTVAALVDPEQVPSVQFLVTAGEPMTNFVHKKWAGKGLYQGYGPSETTNICTVNAAMPSSDTISNIGPAFPNTSAFVIDPHDPFRILPHGAFGEFAFGGEQVFRGYIGREDLNAEKITNHQEYGRIYRSGDMGRMLPGGTMLISGRLDDQVKVRGNRIELGEINASVLSLPFVDDCTTMVLGKHSAMQSIATFWIPTGSLEEVFQAVSVTEKLEQQTADIYSALESSLPLYMVPTFMIPMTKLPRTTQGKLDKRLLESTALALDEVAKRAYSRSAGAIQGDDEPWSSVELDLAAALSTIIELPPTELDRNASFFALGLNSINAIAFATALRKRIGQVVSVGAILRNASIARLAQAIDTEPTPQEETIQDLSVSFSQVVLADIESKLTASSRYAVAAILPCTPLQEAMLSVGDSQTDAAYSNRTSFKVHGDVSKLEQCFEALVERHAILRTVLTQTSDPNRPYAQVVLDRAGLPWNEQIHEKDTNGGGAMDSPLVSLEHPFSFSIETVHNEVFVVLRMHHAIYDGTSMSLLLEEAEELYHDRKLPPAPSFEPFLKEIQVHAGPTALKFWSSYIRGYNSKPFPVRTKDDELPASENGCIQLSLPTQQSVIDEFSKRHNVSAASIYQAAWTKVLAKAQHADDVCFGDVVSGRSLPVTDIDRLVAPCFNTLPVRITIDGLRGNIELVRKLHHQRQATDRCQLTPLRRIQALSRTPDVHLFDSLLLVQPPGRDLDTSIWQLHEDEGLMDLPLVIEITQGYERSNLVVHYDTRFFTQSSASVLMNAFVNALRDCLQFPASNIHDITDADAKSLDGLLATRLVVEEFSDTSMDDTGTETWAKAEDLVRQAYSHFGNIDAEKIRRHTSLYRLGLDSLHAVQVASRLRSHGLSVTAADVLEHRTPTAIAMAATATNESDERLDFDFAKYDMDRRSRLLEPLNIRDTALESLRPCTPSQSGMIAQSLQSRGALYVNHNVYEVPEGVTEDALRSAWRKVQLKHQALRMGFAQTEEAHCPFAMMIYRGSEVDVSFWYDDNNATNVGIDMINMLHRPVWRVTLDYAHKPRRMTLSAHHAIYDAESLRVILVDLARAVQHKGLRQSPSIDGILHQMLATDTGSQAESFWRKALERCSPTPFPNLSPIVTSHTDLYSVQTFSGLTLATLESLCKTKGCTIQAAGQTAWAMLLSAYVAEAEVTFGTVFSGRNGVHNESIVFPALATVPVVCNTAKDPSTILQDMTDFNGSAQRYKHVSLSDLQRFANIPGQALFDTVFVYQKSSSRASDDSAWPILEQSAAVDYSVSLELETTSEKVSFVLTANRGIVPETHANLLLEQYNHVLKQVLGKRTPSTSDVAMLYSATPPRAPALPSPVQLLHQFVEQGSKNMPNSPALEFVRDLSNMTTSRQVWTYRELNNRANQVAHMILAGGAKPGDIVAVCMHKCPQASFAFIGILKAGCAFLALDPELPQARKEFILTDSGSTVLLVNGADELQIEDSPANTLDLGHSDLDGFPTSPVEIATVNPQATCYCLYTSGTTGTPKGCELTHENAVQAMMAFQKLFAGRWNESSRWLQFASYWFDVSVLEQFWSWSVGITLVGAPRDMVLDDIALFIQRLRITHIDLTPSLARILDPEDVPSLWDGVFITGGESLKQEIIEKWGDHRAICNGYGPTEATIGVTMNTFIGPDAKASNIGPAFLNVGSYVFTPGTTVPVLRGAVGELCVTGRLVGKGYLNRPELTAKAFPILEDTGEKIYRTGDLVRQLTDGSFLFIGRQDSQAKLRGQRLEIDEIDSVIKSSTDSVTDLASLVVKSGEKETLITFFITEIRKQTADLHLDTSEQARTAAHAALQACRSRLPGYMVPTHILPLNVIPLTVNNKIDAKRLTVFYNELSVSALQSNKGEPAATQALGANAKKICEVLERMLAIDAAEINANTNIFSLGMSSVSAITFATLLKRNGFTGVDVASIMQHPTVGELADVLSRKADNSPDLESIRQAQLSMGAFGQRYSTLAAARLAMDLEDIEIVAPCTPLQQGMILESIRDENFPYFNHFTFDVSHLDIDHLKKAFGDVVKTVQLLRARFIETNDGHAQVILRKPEYSWHHKTCAEQDLNTMSEQHRQKWLMRNHTELLSPMEALVLESPRTQHLIIFMHHALYDGISFDMIIDQVSEAYYDRPIDCGPKFIDALPYGPLRVQKNADVFWRQHIGAKPNQELPPLTTVPLPEDPSVASTSFRGAMLNNACKRLGVSHQAVLQACFAVALHQLGPEISVYGTVVSGRSFGFERAEQVMGPLFNTVPSPLHLQADDTWSSLVSRCHEFNVAALPYQHSPLRDIKRWCQRLPSDPVFDAIFVFQNLQATKKSAADFIWKPLDDVPKATYPLAFELELRPEDELKATIVAKQEVADEAMLGTLLQYFDRCLDLLSQDSSQHIRERFQVTDNPSIKSGRASESKVEKPSLNGVSDFTWTIQAKMIRSEIANLASLEENEIDEHCSVFSLGLDSIDTVKLASRLKKTGITISVSTLIRAQTIPRMIASVQQDNGESTAEHKDSRLEALERQLPKYMSFTESFDRTQIERILPATPSQEGLISEMIRSDFLEYYNHDVLRLSVDTDVQRLSDAWETVIRRSPILRTSFVEVSSPNVDAVYAQVVHMPKSIEFGHVELRDVAEMDGVLDRIRGEAKLSLSVLPPTRLTLVTAASERYLILSLAHAQYDGHSLALIHQDVQDAYAQQSVDARPSPDSLIEASLAAVDHKVLAFWRNNLAGAYVSRMPQTNSGGDPDTVHRVEDICAVATSEARLFCRSNGLSLQALAQTAWAVTLAHHTGRLDVVFGAVLACRDSEEAESVVFPLMNTVPMRGTLHGTRREMAKHMQDVSTDVLAHQRTPLRHIQRVAAGVVHSEEHVDGNALFDTLFIYQHRPGAVGQQRQALYESVGGSSNIEYPVAVELEAEGENMILRAACKDIVLSECGAQNLLKTLDQVLQSVVHAPNEPTVSFRDSKASICGLPVMRLQSETTREDLSFEPDDRDHDTSASSIEATTIKNVLCQVSRTPPEELSASSTIESIGIDSISAIKVAALLRKQGIKLSVGEIIRAKTVPRMASVVHGRATASPPEDSAADNANLIARYAKQQKLDEVPLLHDIEAGNVQAVFPALPGQTYMLSVWQMTRGVLFYPTFEYRLATQVTEDQLRSAWDALTRKHDILRTIFCVTTNTEVPIAQVVLKTVPGTFIASDEQIPGALQQPMAHLRAAKSSTIWTLKLHIHHALYDAVSLPLLMEDFETILSGSSPTVSPVSQVDFFACSLAPKARYSRREFWKTYLSDTNITTMPQPNHGLARARVEIFKPALLPTTGSLQSTARKEQITPQSLLFAAYARVYAQAARRQTSNADKDDVIIGVYLSNRTHIADLSTLRSPTLNLLPLLVRSASTAPLLQNARQIQNDLALISTPENSSVSLWEIHSWTGRKVDTFINFQRQQPDTVDAERNGALSKLEVQESARLAARSHVVNDDGEFRAEEFQPAKELSSMMERMHNAYLHSIDLEATMTASGTLDVGLFCPQDMVGLEEAENIVGVLRSELEGLSVQVV